MIYDLECKIVENRHISGKTFILKVEAPQIAKNTKAGQFVMIKPTLNDYYDPLLRRAFAIADVEGDVITLFYDVYGKGTKFLTTRKEGDSISILGPLGNNLFPENYDNYIVVGGGIGFAGVSLFLKEIIKKGAKYTALYGARKKEDLSMIQWINQNNIDVIYYTDDGSFGKKGLITQDLEEIIDKNPDAPLIVCGPKPMMKAVSKVAISKNRECYLSLESRMACGIGICVGCVVKDVSKDNYVRVCYEGPVFEAKEIELL